VGEPAVPYDGRCLFVTRQVPLPASSGTRLRALQLLRTLSRHWQLHIVAGEGGLDEAARLAAALGATVDVAQPEGRSRNLRDVAAAMAQGIPLAMARHHHPELIRAVRRRLADTPVDLAIVHSLHLAGVRKAVGGVPVLLDFDNLEGQIWQRYAGLKPFPARQLMRFEGLRLLRYQARVARSVAASACVSEREAGWLRQNAPGATVIVVPNTIDVPATMPDRNPAGPLLFVGGLNWFANADGLRWFMADIWPLLKAAEPDLCFNIVGQPARSGTAGIDFKRPGVTFLGAVDRLEQAYAHSAIVVVPLRVGAGTRLKILEAFARGLPVVSTAMGADGLDVVAGRHFLEASTPEAMAAAVARLRRDATLAERLRREAYALVSEKYAGDGVVQALRALHWISRPPARSA
jgi:glycosyltransferase involved in cell wall biosynthesis